MAVGNNDPWGTGDKGTFSPIVATRAGSLDRVLRKREAEWVPVVNEEAQINAFILSKIDGHTSLGQIARALATKFPMRFMGWEDALSRVGDVTS